MTDAVISEVEIKYGAHPNRITSLHEMFYDARGKKLIYRFETDDNLVEPFCVYCTQEYSIAAMDNCKGRCLYCAACPLCRAGLTKTSEPPFQYVCQTCRWMSSSSGLQVTETSDAAEGEELLKDRLLEFEDAQSTSSQFSVLTSLLANVVNCENKLGTPTPSSPSLMRRPSARFKKPEGMAMGLDRVSLAEFETRLEGDKAQKQNAGSEMLKAAELAWGQYEQKEEILLPIRQELVVRSAVRYQRHLLAAEAGSDGSRRLNRNAAAMLPRLLVANTIKGKTINEPFNVILALVSPSTYHVHIENISCSDSSGCTVAVPELQQPVTLDPKPETESHKPLYYSPSELQPAKVVSNWDNTALISLVFTPTEQPPPTLSVTLCLSLAHSVDGEESKILLYSLISLNTSSLKKK
eukprot:TRINITY_DN31246_c0_g1_i1.p1 TRINITY_DN31246_c0_g1~~TRINITY_DN31246_c0_g1_i1.p1  ORF type:complete len:423 (+),score=66.34 TRINITY_DN31246_c0_g1_i1:44-1270(+)